MIVAPAFNPAEVSLRSVLWLALVTLAALTAILSGWRAPYLYDRELGSPLLNGPVPPISFLYRRKDTSVYFTPMDLLTPQRWGPDTIGIDAVGFDVEPGTEPWSRRGEQHTWVIQCGEVVAEVGLPRTGRSNSVVEDLAEIQHSMRRGEVHLYRVPLETGYTEATGVADWIILGIALPKDPIGARPYRDLSQGAAVAIREMVRQARSRGIRTIGLPRIRLAESLGTPVTEVESWRRLLDLIDEQIVGSGIRTVVVGGFAMTAAARTARAAQFQDAWKGKRKELALGGQPMTHGAIRLWAACLFVAAGSRCLAKTPFVVRQAVAVTILAAGVGAVGSRLADWLQPVLGWNPSTMSGVVTIALAMLGGAAVRSIALFDPKKEI